MLRLILILFSLSLMSCSQQSGKTSAEFRLSMGALGTPAKFAGGLVVYGKTASNSMSFVRVLDSESLSNEIPNGLWTFFAIGWDASSSGTGESMSGKVYCGVVGDVKLDGNPVEVNLNVSNSKCSEKIFTANYNQEGMNIRFPKLQVETCNALLPGMLIDSTVTCDYDSSTDPTKYKALKGFAGSYRLAIRSFDRVDTDVRIQDSFLASTCVKVSTMASGQLDGTGLEGLNIPTGNAALQTPFQFYLRAFYTDDCSDSKGYKDIVFRHGAIENHDNAKSIVYDFSGTQKTKIFAKTSMSEVCSGERLSATPFAAGLGSPGHPFVICTLAQFNKINSHLTNSFVLGRDLNFLPQTAAYMTTPLACTNFLENFEPIGGYSDCSNFAEDSPSTFSGNFDGLGKTLKNIRLEKEEAEQIGLIRNLTGKLMNLTLENAYVAGGNEVGAAVGRCGGGTSICDIYNVTVNDSTIESSGVGASSVVGGVVGYAENATIKKVLVYDSRIVGQQESVGGVAGKVVSSIFSKALAENIRVEGNSSGANNVGGVVGYAGTTNLSEVAAKGYVKSEGQYVGGVVGYFDQTAFLKSISDAYSHVYVDSRRNSFAFAGGLGGKIIANSVNDSYVAGKVSHECSDPTVLNCKIGCVAGLNVTSTDVFCEANSKIMSFGGYDGNVDGPYDMASMRSSVATGYYGTKLDSNPKWTKTATMLPRLNFEPVKPCHLAINIASAPAQIDNGRGTSDNPVIICNPAQLASIEDNSSAYYQLEESFRVGEVTTNNMLLGFNGVFNGNNKNLFDLTLNGTGDYVGLFKTIANNGVVINLFVQAQDITSGGNLASGVIAGKNNGTIENVSVLLSSDIVLDKLGGVVGENHGTMTQVYSYGDVSESTIGHLGGIVKVNFGNLSQCFSEMNLIGSQNIGGIAASNSTSGTISECESAVSITGTTGNNIGGIADTNSGTIENSFFSNSGEIVLADSNNVAGIAGSNSGTISNTYSAGSIYVASDSPTTIPKGIANGTGTIQNSYYLQNSVMYNFGEASGAFLGITTPTCTTSTTSTFTFKTVNSSGSSALNNKSYNDGDIIKVTDNTGNSDYLTIAEIPVPISDGVQSSFTVEACPSFAETIVSIAIFSPVNTDSKSEIEMNSLNTYENWEMLEVLADLDQVVDYYLSQIGFIESTAPAPVWGIRNNSRLPFLFKLDH